MSLSFYFLIPLFAASIVLLINVFKKYSGKLGLVDAMNERSSHHGIIPRIGGVSVFIPFIVLTTILIIFQVDFIVNHVPFLIGLIATATLGCLDDRLDLSGKLKFFIQLGIGTYYVISTGNYVDNMYGFFGIHELHYLVGISVSVLTIAFLINAVNLSDGIDGLSASTSLLSLTVFTFLMGGDYHYYLLTFVGIGLLIYLRFNLASDKKIFLGDAGSLSLGFILSTMAMEYLHSYNGFAVSPNINPHFVAMLALIYPIADTLRVFFLRVSSGQSPFTADRKHLHHILIDKGYSHIGACIFILFCVSTTLLINKFVSTYINDYAIIFVNSLIVLFIHLFVRFRSVQLCKFWRSFSRTIYRPVKKVLTKYAIN
jgi:UDP-N-acetylmuramyl pentapeptide phosphotransferase/UDP-N-acetylglucosamine-1-phosphate transferase